MSVEIMEHRGDILTVRISGWLTRPELAGRPSAAQARAGLAQST